MNFSGKKAFHKQICFKNLLKISLNLLSDIELKSTRNVKIVSLIL